MAVGLVTVGLVVPTHVRVEQLATISKQYIWLERTAYLLDGEPLTGVKLRFSQQLVILNNQFLFCA